MFTLFAFKIDIFVSMLIRPEKTKNYYQMTCDVISDLTFKCFTFLDSSCTGVWGGACSTRGWYFLVSCRPYDGEMS